MPGGAVVPRVRREEDHDVPVVAEDERRVVVVVAPEALKDHALGELAVGRVAGDPDVPGRRDPARERVAAVRDRPRVTEVRPGTGSELAVHCHGLLLGIVGAPSIALRNRVTSSAERRCAGRPTRVPFHNTRAPPPGSSRAGPTPAAGHAVPSARGAANGAAAPAAGRRAAKACSRRARTRCDQATTARPSSSAVTAMAFALTSAPSSPTAASGCPGAASERCTRASCTWSRQASSTRPAGVTAAPAIVTPPPGLTCSGGPNAPAPDARRSCSPSAARSGDVLGAVGQRDGAAVTDGRLGRVAHVPGQQPRCAEAPARAAQGGPHRGARGRCPCRGGIAARPDRDGHARAAGSAYEGGERLGWAEPGAAGLARRGLQAPARAAVAKPHDDRGAAGGDGRRGEVRAGTGRRERLRPAEPPAGAERDRADAARALHHDEAAAVGGDARVDGAVGRARAHEHPRRPEGPARRRGPPAHTAERPGVGPRARTDHVCAAVARDGEGGGDVARRDDLRGIRGRGGDEHQPHGPATRTRRLHAWGTHRAACRLRRAARPPSGSRSRQFAASASRGRESAAVRGAGRRRRSRARWRTNRASFATPSGQASNVGPTASRRGKTDVRPGPPRRQGRKMLRNARRAENLRRHRDNGARPGRLRSFSLGEQLAAQRRKRPRRPGHRPAIDY